jgi:hypothetical protein
MFSQEGGQPSHTAEVILRLLNGAKQSKDSADRVKSDAFKTTFCSEQRKMRALTLCPLNEVDTTKKELTFEDMEPYMRCFKTITRPMTQGKHVSAADLHQSVVSPVCSWAVLADLQCIWQFAAYQQCTGQFCCCVLISFNTDAIQKLTPIFVHPLLS